MNDKWVTFWFEGNSAWGLIDSPEEWQRIKEAYGGSNCRDAERSRSNYEVNGIPYFGYRSECVGPETLGEWADKQGMTL